MNLFEVLGILVVIVVVFNVLKFLLRLMFAYLACKQDSRFSRKSEYREAFIMECSDEMLTDKDNNYARNLDKAITYIDAQNSKIEKVNRKVNKNIQNIKM